MFTLSSLWLPLAQVFITLVFSAHASILYLVTVLSSFQLGGFNSCSLTARASSANYRLVNRHIAYAYLPIIFSQGIRHATFGMLKMEGILA